MAQEMAWEMAREMPREMPQEMPREMVEGTNLFKKEGDWWKFSIWNGLMGS